MNDPHGNATELVERTSISLAALMMKTGKTREKAGGFKSFSAYVEALIRADAQKGIVAPKTKNWMTGQLAA